MPCRQKRGVKTTKIKKEIFAVDKTFFLKNLPYFAFFIRGNKKLAKKTFCTSSSLLSVQSQRKNNMGNKK